MRAFLRFNKGMMKMPMHWQLWVGLLVVANMVVPILFIKRPEAQAVLAAMFASMILMTVLTSLTGFSRLLGLGHIFWVPLLVFLWTRLSGIPTDDFFNVNTVADGRRAESELSGRRR